MLSLTLKAEQILQEPENKVMKKSFYLRKMMMMIKDYRFDI
jgi:hypothetical protein